MPLIGRDGGRTGIAVEKVGEGELTRDNTDEVAPLKVIGVLNVEGNRNNGFDIGDGVGLVERVGNFGGSGVQVRWVGRRRHGSVAVFYGERRGGA